MVKPVNNFCSEAEYHRFMQPVPEFEHMLYIVTRFHRNIVKID